MIRYMEGAPGAYDSLHAGRSSMMSEMRVQAGAEMPFLTRAK